MKYTAAGLLVVAGLVAGVSPASAEFSLSIRDGKVTLVADNVTVRQILTEWARVGQTKVVNVEKLSGPPVTLRLENVPEGQALDILLRASSGFMVALRPVDDPAASIYDRILLMPPSTASASAALSRPAPPASAPVAPPMTPPVPPPQGNQSGDDDAEPDEPPPSPYANTGDARPPETNFDYANPQEFLRRRQEMLQQQQQQQAPAAAPSLFPGSVTPYSQPQQPPPAATPSATPGATGGTARPGEITKPPQGQPQVYNPYGIRQPGTPGAAAEPDRAKYANPYQNPPQE